MPHPQMEIDPTIAVHSPGDVWIGAAVGDLAKDYLLHWDGAQWRKMWVPPAFPACVCAPPVTTDDHGGVWVGSWAHWTGSVWVDTGATAPTLANLAFSQLTWVPGTSASYAVGSAYTGRSPSAYHAAVVVYGPIP